MYEMQGVSCQCTRPVSSPNFEDCVILQTHMYGKMFIIVVNIGPLHLHLHLKSRGVL